MGITKSDKFTVQQNDIALLFKAFAHPARVAIIQHLSKIDSCVCGDFVTEIGLAQPTISQHLKELKQLGIINGTVSGASMCYCINIEKWSNIKKVMFSFLNQKIIDNHNCC